MLTYELGHALTFPILVFLIDTILAIPAKFHFLLSEMNFVTLRSLDLLHQFIQFYLLLFGPLAIDEEVREQSIDFQSFEMARLMFFLGVDAGEAFIQVSRGKRREGRNIDLHEEPST